MFERSHYLPVFARLGAYDKALLDTLTFARRGPYTEYWAHEAALIPVDDWPLFRFRMQDYRELLRARRRPVAARDHAECSTGCAPSSPSKGPLPPRARSSTTANARKRGRGGSGTT